MALAMVAIIGLAGFVVDVGHFYEAHRQQQAIADAAALAAAGDLPSSTGTATADAQSYAAKNGGSAASVTFSTRYLPDDTVTVKAQTTVQTVFAKAVGIDSVHIGATSVARAENLSTAWGAAPFGVINTQQQLVCGSGCFGQQTTLDLNKAPGPGGFGVINIDGSHGGTGPGTLAEWIKSGCSCSTGTPVWLYSDPGAKFNSSQVKGAMDAIVGKNLLFPVYDQTQGSGANLQYHIVGWAGFHVTGYNFQGSSGTITGSFVKVDWKGDGTSSTSTYYGATTSRLVDNPDAP